MSTGTNDQLTHEALFYDSDEEFLDSVVPFVRAGLETGDHVVLVCPSRTENLLAAELARDSRVAYLDHHDIYTTPNGAIATYREILDEYMAADVQHVRVVGDALDPGDPQARAEWGHYEAVVNHAMQDYPVSAMCTYDTRSIPPDLLAQGRFTHPVLVSHGALVTNPDYLAPDEYLRRTTDATPDPLESTQPDISFDDVTCLEALRGQLKAALRTRTHAVEPAGDFMLAINEVVTNAVRHADPPYCVRMWLTSERFLATVTDHGRGFDDPFAGYEWPGRPEGAPTGGMGLWLARRLCDHVDFSRRAEGFTVRLEIRPHQHQHGRAATRATAKLNENLTTMQQATPAPPPSG
jgi:anti-sigma regulatory factor (Ser/Thr protein kinase)